MFGSVRFLVAIVFAIGLAFESATAENAITITYGADIRPQALEYEVAAAARIARVRIIGVETKTFGLNNTYPPCGYIYKTLVIDPLKGNSNPLNFYSDKNRFQVGAEYLLFLHKIPSDVQNREIGLKDLLTADEAVRIACRSTLITYFLPLDRQTYFPFSASASAKFSGEWLKAFDPTNEPGFLWCSWAKGASLEVTSSHRAFTAKELETGNRRSLVIGWQSAKTLIEHATMNSPYLLWGIPNPFFRPGSC